ncbi:MAG: hypothetical protein CFE21_00215 [Bacteroidetes bacterium B1(2017)]|nr:MAG: hypothetical protein CFE21_00215 [Bacteroidetes bacterium B1(2017)]
MRLFLCLPEGHTVRNILENNFIGKVYERWPNAEIVIFTPAYNIKEFTGKWSRKYPVTFKEIIPYTLNKRDKFWLKLKKKVITYGLKSLVPYILNQERKESHPYYCELIPFFKEKAHESIMLCTHIHLPHERPLANLATSLGIPVVGIVNSWDNVYKGIMTHVDEALVWNEVNRNEMFTMESYPKKKVKIMGVHAFEPYFNKDNLYTREAFATQIGLDPKKPILVYASIGQFVPFFEETFVLDKMVEYSLKFEESKRPQIICRLHPWSKKALFDRFSSVPDLVFSEFKTYIPTLNWTPTYEEVVFSLNMLSHADICVSPGSTMVLESAFLDTPFVVPVYNEYQPYIWRDYYSRFCLAWHFGRLVKNTWVKLAMNNQEFFEQMDENLEFPEKYKKERSYISAEYVGDEREPIRNILEAISRNLKNS